MRHLKITIAALFVLLATIELQAQETVSATGGNATGAGGSSSYTVGQVVYTTSTGTNGSVAQGVQQPYEISISVGIEVTEINLELSVYPNPTTNYLTLKVEDNANLSLQLYDLQSKIIENKTLSSNSTKISLERQPNATYFLKVLKDNRIVKIFKVIKN